MPLTLKQKTSKSHFEQVLQLRQHIYELFKKYSNPLFKKFLSVMFMFIIFEITLWNHTVELNETQAIQIDVQFHWIVTLISGVFVTPLI